MTAERDWALVGRMAATLGVVVVATALFVALALALVDPWVRSVVRPLASAVGLADQFVRFWWVPVGLVLLAGCLVAQVRYVRRETLAAVDARRVTEADRPELCGRVTRLAAQVDASVPVVYVADSPVPNSFALDGGGEPLLVVSVGLLANLDEDEREAVLAHEVAHLANRDATVMTLASFLPALTSDRYSVLDALGPWARHRAVWLFGLGGLYVLGALAGGRSPLAPGYAVRAGGAFVVLVVVGGVALGVFAALTALAARRLSRYREFVADRSAATVTGDPATLAATLERLDGDSPTRPTGDARAHGTVRGLCLLPHGFHPDADATADDVGFHVPTRTHPPTDARIDRLRALVRADP